MRNARLDEAQAGIKIAGRNINSLRYADDNSLMAEIEEELKSLLMKVKEECEIDLVDDFCDDVLYFLTIICIAVLYSISE